MQPLPSSEISSVFTTAADSFWAAAQHLATPTIAAAELETGARATYQGIPSLRWTTARDSAAHSLVPKLTEAAAAALALATELRSGNTAAANADVIKGWSNLTLDAAGAVQTDAFPW